MHTTMGEKKMASLDECWDVHCPGLTSGAVLSTAARDLLAPPTPIIPDLVSVPLIHIFVCEVIAGHLFSHFNVPTKNECGAHNAWVPMGNHVEKITAILAQKICRRKRPFGRVTAVVYEQVYRRRRVVQHIVSPRCNARCCVPFEPIPHRFVVRHPFTPPGP